MRCLLLLLAILSFAVVARADSSTTQPARIAATQAVQNLHGEAITPLQIPADRRAAVLLFIASDCPISNSYAPAFASLCKKFAGDRIDFFAVYVDADLSPAAARQHHDQYAYPCDALLDPQQMLAHGVGISCTPEAAVITSGGVVAYRGRIDDQYVSVGRKRFAATTHELSDVLDEVAAAKPIDVPSKAAIGCPLP